MSAVTIKHQILDIGKVQWDAAIPAKLATLPSQAPCYYSKLATAKNLLWQTCHYSKLAMAQLATTANSP
jgi:hypothetical protein